MRTFYIFASGEYGPTPPTIGESFVIAADGGLEELEKNGRVPDLIVGDFDSYGGALPEGVPVIRHPVMKDDTDSALAVGEALRRGAERIFIYGGLGGRLDHSFANIQLLAGLARRGVEAYLVGERETVTAVCGGLSFGPEFWGRVSVFAYPMARVTETGLLYALDSRVLTDDTPMGVSNEFTGAPSAVTVHEGTAIVMWRTQDTLPEVLH